MEPYRYFLDTEFDEESEFDKIKFISIGIVDADGSEFYRVSEAFNREAVSVWVREHVIPKLPSSGACLPIPSIRDGLKTYFKDTINKLQHPPPEVEIWARNGSYDFVIFSKFFGTQLNMNEFFSTLGVRKVHLRDIKEITRGVPKDRLPAEDATRKHHALCDAQYERDIFFACQRLVLG